MTISEALSRVDGLKHNTYTREEKLGWLSQLDTMILQQVLCSQTPATAPCTSYGPDTDPNTVLLAESPFDEMYLRFMEAQMDYHNGEYSRYNNAILLFNRAFEAFTAHHLRNNPPEGLGRFQY